ncbi:uncharacterized protein METZ01_LOCUS15510 [marine metagenome]|uniref:Uncharacterized protein n=1 Tax=marine metagenome TaxID=408172 RepID=A0A381P6U2_9ZZZZ
MIIMLKGARFQDLTQNGKLPSELLLAA